MTNQSPRRLSAAKLIAIVAALASLVGLLSVSAPSPAAAQLPDTTLQLNVFDYETNTPITTFEYIINIDDTGTNAGKDAELVGPGGLCSPDNPSYPTSCPWTSIAGVPSGSSPIYTQGDQSDFPMAAVPPDRYFISVLADGYKLDGVHLDLRTITSATTTVDVALNAAPLPSGTIQAAVFEDISITNSAPDVPAERGLAGWEAFLVDYGGELSTDAYGNPLGTEYYKPGHPNAGDPIPGTGGSVLSKCYVTSAAVDVGTVQPVDADGRCPIDLTVANLAPANVVAGEGVMDDGNPIPAGAAVMGKIRIENVVTNRYALQVLAPDGAGWIQTTTLEGNHDWDSWVLEGSTGFDTEFTVAGEPFPTAIFGFVKQDTVIDNPGTGSISGNVARAAVYIPARGGTGLPGEIWGGTQGMVVEGPITDAWLSLSDLDAGDTAIWVGPADPVTGAFTIPNVPAGNYTLTWWDESQNHILDLTQIIVGEGEAVDMGTLPLTGWWTHFDGHVFDDTNRNGRMDPGEPGLPGIAVSMRKRENSLMDRGATIVTTDANGYYEMQNMYPMTQWLVMETYDDLRYTTGVTYQADNQPDETTVVGAGVDLSIHPTIGHSGRVDWGLHTYDPTGVTDPKNGGIVGTVSYDVTRAERDPQYAGAEDWQPSIPGMTVNLYAPVDCGTNPGTPCDDDTGQGWYEVAPDGSLAKGALLNTTITEHWERPTNCTPRDADGLALVPGTDEQFMPISNDDNCIEAPLLGIQVDTGDPTHTENPGVAVDGNYGFGDGCYAPAVLDVTDPANPTCEDPGAPGVEAWTTLEANDYLVEVVSPLDERGVKQTFTPTREEDINVNDGIDYAVPAVPPPSCAGPMHIVDVEDPADPGGVNDTHPDVTIDGVVISDTGEVTNPTLADAGGTIYEGDARRLCDTKLVTLQNGASIAPTFLFFTEVPVPGRAWGLIVDDLNFSGNPKSIMYGEKQGVPFAPVGIYDYKNRLVTTAESDFNGLFDVLLPSTNIINAPTPSGIAPNMFRFVGNDPGIPGRLNTNYKPQFRTISADFEIYSGLIVVADLAPSQVGVTVQLPGGQFVQISCPVDPADPQFYAVDTPYVTDTGDVTIQGAAFGAAQGTGQVLIGGAPLAVTSWNDTTITGTVDAGVPAGPQPMEIVRDDGISTGEVLTFHVLRATGGGGAPVEPTFPATGILDDFNRGDAPFGTDWEGFFGASQSRSSVVTNEGALLGSVRFAWDPETNGVDPGKEGGGLFDADQEAYLTIRQLPSANRDRTGLVLKYTGNSFGARGTYAGGAFIEVVYNDDNDVYADNRIEVYSKDRTETLGTMYGAGPDYILTEGVDFAPITDGDVLGARTLHDGTVVIYLNGTEIGRTNVVTAGWSAELADSPGAIGVSGIRFNGTTNLANRFVFDDFGGGSVALNSLTTLADATFPAATTVLDDFSTQATANLGGNWAGNKTTSIYQVTDPGDDVLVQNFGRVFWDPRDRAAGVFDANQEAWFTFNELSPIAASQQGLMMKYSGDTFGGADPVVGGAWVEVSFSPNTDGNPNDGQIDVWVKPRGVNTNAAYGQSVLSIPATVNVGDQLGVRTLTDGTTIVFLNGTELGRVDVTDPAWDTPWPDDIAAHPGYVGAVFRGMIDAAAQSRFDDFGGGSIRSQLTTGDGYQPTVYTVGPLGGVDPNGQPFDFESVNNSLAGPNPTGSHAIQEAIDAAALSPEDDLIVVYPEVPTGEQIINPRGAYYENLIMTQPVKLQGVGAGSPDGSVRGSIIDGSAFAGDSPVFDAWWTRMEAQTFVGNQTIFDGSVISLFAETSTSFFPAAPDPTTNPSIDGFDIRGGNQQGFPGNINVIGGGGTGQPAGLVTQGGAIYSNGFTPNLQITNNVIQNNGGAYGTIRIGSPDVDPSVNANHNITIRANRIVANGGTNLAGAIGLFAGSDNYEVAHNDICGNFSAEYGGGVSHYGYSPGGEIHHNRITLNESFDEGGGVMIAGALPADPTTVSDGAGSVSINNNVIERNLSNDDGGGIRFLMAGTETMNVFNNMIVNNVSTHEGGGIALNDATDVNIYNNTIMKNLTTATAATSLGQPAPAGLSSTAYSAPLAASLGFEGFSDPNLFNNIFWDNRAGSRSGATVIGLDGTSNWDMGVPDGSGLFSPVNSILDNTTYPGAPSATAGYNADASNSVGTAPSVVDAVDLMLNFDEWRANPTFIGAIIVTVDALEVGDYHLAAANSVGVAGTTGGVSAPDHDIDGDPRPTTGSISAGADELQL